MLLVLLVVTTILEYFGNIFTDGRAIMIEPPHRSSLWRFHYPTNMNTEDDLLNCGGFEVQWYYNGGKCGVCGDPAWGKQNHDDQGHYASGVIVRNYNQGGAVNVTVEVLSNLLGYFEFRLCPRNSTKTKITNECFDQNILWIEESWSTRFYVGSKGGIYDLHVKLPSNVVCSNCVFQWKYSTGYRMGGVNECECMGCGRQEQFYNCADVAILPTSGTHAVRQTGFLPVKQSISFLSSPENQSNAFRQKMREQLPVYPWPNGLLIPHNMMVPSTTLSLKPGSQEPPSETKTFGGHQHHTSVDIGNQTSVVEPVGDHHHFHTSIAENINKGPPAGSLPYIKGIDLTQFPEYTSSTLKSNIIHEPVNGSGMRETYTSQPPITSMKSSTFLPEKSTFTPTQSTPFYDNRLEFDRRKWNFTEQKFPWTPPKPAQSPDAKTKYINNTDRVQNDSITYPSFNKSVKTTTLNKTKQCDKSTVGFHCMGRGFYSTLANMDNWCTENCKAGNCPQNMCLCGCKELIQETPVSCKAIGSFAIIPGMNEWCTGVCNAKKCPSNICDLRTCVRRR